MRHNEANIELRIEELILHDLPYDQRHRVAAAIEQELTRLLGEHGAPPAFANNSSPLEVNAVVVNPNLTAETMALQVANAIFGQIQSRQGKQVA